MISPGLPVIFLARFFYRLHLSSTILVVFERAGVHLTVTLQTYLSYFLESNRIENEEHECPSNTHKVRTL